MGVLYPLARRRLMITVARRYAMANIHPLLEPFQPAKDSPFNRDQAAHLLNRAAFGGMPDEIARVQEMGPRRAVDWLLDFPDASR